jgi:hypothetical protein
MHFERNKLTLKRIKNLFLVSQLIKPKRESAFSTHD